MEGLISYLFIPRNGSWTAGGIFLIITSKMNSKLSISGPSGCDWATHLSNMASSNSKSFMVSTFSTLFDSVENGRSKGRKVDGRTIVKSLLTVIVHSRWPSTFSRLKHQVYSRWPSISTQFDRRPFTWVRNGPESSDISDVSGDRLDINSSISASSILLLKLGNSQGFTDRRSKVWTPNSP